MKFGFFFFSCFTARSFPCVVLISKLKFSRCRSLLCSMRIEEYYFRVQRILCAMINSFCDISVSNSTIWGGDLNSWGEGLLKDAM